MRDRSLATRALRNPITGIGHHYGRRSEWAESRVLQVQFQHIKGTDLGQFKDLSTQVVITPAQYKSGDVIYPYEKAK